MGYNNPTGEFCYHDWVLYEGVTDKYQYCSKCDKKRSMEEVLEEQERKEASSWSKGICF